SPFASYLFSTSSRKIEEALHTTLIEKGYTLAFAESCSGGKMASRIVAMSGASRYFLGSIVAYSDQLKEKMLSVSRKTLEQEGAVSKQTVLEMAEGVLQLTGANCAISVSGIAGPLGGTKDKPVGTVWGAIGVKGGEIFAGKLTTLKGVRRDLIIDYASSYLFFQLYRYLHHKIPPFTP
ncbi:MAG: CinA family protein, partial [Simkania negevensis]|nr:CinA family protein [Simkania negevensis]